MLTVVVSVTEPSKLLARLDELAARLDKHRLPHNVQDLRNLFFEGAAHVVRSKRVRNQLEYRRM